jgi:cytochrome oxidase Cu insertion factor (SCO1/SenC/PrrC family)
MFKVRGPGGASPDGPFKGVSVLLAAVMVLSCCAHSSYGSGTALQQPGAQPQRAAGRSVRNKQGSEIVIPDEEVIDQDGKRIKFYDDLVKGKVAFIQFIYTTCEPTCPMQGASLAKLQPMLGERLGRDVYFISVSIDPETDSPGRLKAWGAKLGARRGWKFVTGGREEIDRIIRAFTGGSIIKEEHTPIVYAVNDIKGVWTSGYGLAPPERLARLIDQVGGSAPK